MNYQCKNCGGNVVYSPKIRKMHCPYCDSIDSEEKAGDASMTVCASCGGELSVGTYTSASRCPFCDNYLIYDERVTKQYKPDTILPFTVSKEAAVEAMEKEFKKRTFAPVSFLSEKSLESMNGRYVPFFLYDYEVDSEYRGTGTKVRTWSSGNYDYTETSYYDVARRLVAKFDNIPADASYEMDNDTMDLMEPYDYKELISFDPKYMSGFFGEIYNDAAENFEQRAKLKALDSAKEMMNASLSGYATLHANINNSTIAGTDVDYSLLPVWVYKYSWMGKEYPFFINGQTGKVIGKTPVSKIKILLYGLTVGGAVFGMLHIAIKLLEVL